MAHEPIAQPKRRVDWLRLGIIVCVVGACVILPAIYIWKSARDSQPVAVSGVQEITVSVTVAEIPPTNTQPPSKTPRPSRTPWPSLTATEIPPDIITVIEYVQITTTPLPTYTPFPTWTQPPNPTATEIPLYVQSKNQDMEARIMWRGIGMNFARTFISPRFVIVLLVVAGIAYVINRYNKWMDTAPTVDDTTETTAEIKERIDAIEQAKFAERVRRLRENERLNKEKIAERLFPGKARGGENWNKVSRVLNECDPLGVYGPTTPPPHPPTSVDAATQA